MTDGIKVEVMFAVEVEVRFAVAVLNLLADDDVVIVVVLAKGEVILKALAFPLNTDKIPPAPHFWVGRPVFNVSSAISL